MLRREAERLLAFREYFRQIELRQHGFALSWCGFRSPRAAPVFSLTIQRRLVSEGRQFESLTHLASKSRQQPPQCSPLHITARQSLRDALG